MPADQTQHIYFLVHSSHQRFKVGTALHPLRRWAQIQPHDQTDFTESVVFDLAPGVSVTWAERTLHRALVHAHLDMPRDADGHSEWFDYGSLELARAFAQEHSDLLGFGEGYTIALPQKSDRVPPARRRTDRAGWLFDLPDDPAPFNVEAAEHVEEYVDRWMAFGALVGSTMSEEGMHVYFDQSLIPYEELPQDTYCTLYSALNVLGKPMMRGSTRIFGGHASTGQYIRLSVIDPFGGAEPLDTVTHPRCLKAGRAESWEQVAPGAERVRMAIRRLHAMGSFDATGIDTEIESFWKELFGTSAQQWN